LREHGAVTEHSNALAAHPSPAAGFSVDAAGFSGLLQAASLTFRSIFLSSSIMLGLRAMRACGNRQIALGLAGAKR
jgi:hypothetical protein